MCCQNSQAHDMQNAGLLTVCSTTGHEDSAVWQVRGAALNARLAHAFLDESGLQADANVCDPGGVGKPIACVVSAAREQDLRSTVGRHGRHCLQVVTVQAMCIPPYTPWVSLASLPREASEQPLQGKLSQVTWKVIKHRSPNIAVHMLY